MAITTKRITMRQGNEADWKPEKMLSAEMAVIKDKKELHFAYADGKTKRVATEDDISKLSGQNGNQSGLTTAVKNALLNAFSHVLWEGENGQSYYDTLATALNSSGSGSGGSGEGGDEGSGDDGGTTVVTLTSISATYTGGSVESGTSLSDLTGITVTATYSDGSTKTVSNYELSGEIGVGENIITVSYGGKTTTIKITGTASNKVYLNFNGLMTNSGKTFYSDDGETTYSFGNVYGLMDNTQKTYDVDVDVYFKCIAPDTVYWQNGNVGSYDKTANAVYRCTSCKGYYKEGNNSQYITEGNVYEGVYTLKAGCHFVLGLVAPNFKPENLDMTDGYVYIVEPEVI